MTQERLVNERATGGEIYPTYAFSNAFRVFLKFLPYAGSNRQVILGRGAAFSVDQGRVDGEGGSGDRGNGWI